MVFDLYIYNQLEDLRQATVYDIAVKQLEEQNSNSYLLESAVEFEYDNIKQSIDKSLIDFVTYRNREESIPMLISVSKTSAGSGVMIYEDSDMVEVLFPEEEVYDDSKEVAGVVVKGDSMEPKYHDGDVLWIDSRRPVESGQIAVFMIDGESYVKKKGNNKLISLNNKYDDIEIMEYTEFITIGKVVDFTPKSIFEEIEAINWQ